MTSPAERPAVCVYCGSRNGTDPAYADAAARLGRVMGERRLDLVYGGGHVGLMGVIADAVNATGGRVTGVITEHLLDREVGHRSIDELIVVPDMPTRKREMFDRADAFVVLPGGVGTMEELFEVWCWASLGLHPKRLGLLNVSGYYDSLLGFMQRAVDDGMFDRSSLDLAHVAKDPEELLDLMDLGTR